MNQTDDFGEWLVYHCTAFGFNDDKAKGVAAWRSAFDGKRYTRVELRTATDQMLSETPIPKYLTDHLERIHALVREQRRIAASPTAEVRQESVKGIGSWSAEEWMPMRAKLVDQGFLTSPEAIESVRQWRAKNEPGLVPVSKETARRNVKAPPPPLPDFKARAAGERDAGEDEFEPARTGAGEEDSGGDVPF